MPAQPKQRSRSLLLISPKRTYRYHWDLKELCEIMRKRTAVHPLALPTVAALTPEHYDIRIIDEEMEPIDFGLRPSLVGVTSLGPNIRRAYEIADRFRELGIPVVMGGPQVSFSVEESLKHADCVVIGEAEEIWPQCLADFERGQLRRTYRREQPCDFRTSPRPRWDLVDTGRVMALGVQASRGCPYHCEFCLVRNMFGQQQRYRDLDNLVEEIRSLPKHQITFTDDNLTANKPFARELMARLKPLKVSWMCQASLDLCDDEPLLTAMAEAGCTGILLGIESLNPAALKETGKNQNKTERYEEGIRRIHSRGIHVIGSFIVGFEADHLDAFDTIFDFTVRNNISHVMLNVLTSYPGTDLYDRMQAEGRCTDIDPDLLNGIYPTMRYRNISQADMFSKYFETLARLFSYDVVRGKALRVFGTGAFQRYNEVDISPRDKASSLLHLVRRYLFTADASRRRLFLDLMALVFAGKVNVGNVVEFLLLVSSFNGYLEFTRQHRADILEEIRMRDPGPLVAGD